jgi:hypothetical protein
MRCINQDNVSDYAFINMDALTFPVKAVCVDFHGYTDGRMLTESDAKAKQFGKKGIARVFPYYSVWAWMSRSSQEFNEQVLDAVYQKLQIPDTVPLIITGGSMGGLTALCYQVYGKRKAVACAANCPVTDVGVFFRDFAEARRAILSAHILDERPLEAVRRVLAAQAFVSEEPENPTTFTEEDRETLNAVARDCITAITDPGVDAALPADNKDRIFIIVTENVFDATSDNPETDVANWYRPDRIAKKIRQEFPEAGIEFIPEFSGQKDNDRVLSAATGYKEAVFVTFCSTTSYLGTDGLTRRTEAVMNSLIQSGKVSAILHFGNPYALKNITHVPRKLFGYMITDSQIHAIDVLAGKLEAKGHLPYEVVLP